MLRQSLQRRTFMAILIRTCCCGCDLLRGILLIVIFGLLSASCTTYSNFIFYKILSAEIKHASSISTLEDMSVDYNKNFKAVTSLQLGLVGVAFGGVSVLVNLLLLWSFVSNNRYLAYPYLFWNIFMLLFTFGVTTFFTAILNGFQYIYVVNTPWWLLSIFLIIVVYSHIETLREDPGHQHLIVTGYRDAMQPPPYSKLQEVTAE